MNGEERIKELRRETEGGGENGDPEKIILIGIGKGRVGMGGRYTGNENREVSLL